MQPSRFPDVHVARGSPDRHERGVSIVTLFIALCLMLTSALTAQAAQNANNTPRRMRNVHRTEATAVDADPLDATDARFLLTRTGFEANAAEVALTIGMSFLPCSLREYCKHTLTKDAGGTQIRRGSL